MKKNKKGRWKTVLLVIFILGAIGTIFGNEDDGESKETSKKENSTEQKNQQGITGIEVQKSNDEKYGSINDFQYELSDNKILLKEYNGKSKVLEIQPFYTIDNTEYTTDLSNFQIGIGNKKVETLILSEGITEVQNSIFNSSDVKNIYFPQSMTIVYDNTLSYLNPDDGETIKIYYGGTQEEWLNIFTEYKRTKVEDAEFGEELGIAIADKVNEMAGSEYDSSEFEYFFSANPDSLK